MRVGKFWASGTGPELRKREQEKLKASATAEQEIEALRREIRRLKRDNKMLEDRLIQARREIDKLKLLL